MRAVIGACLSNQRLGIKKNFFLLKIRALIGPYSSSHGVGTKV